MNQAEDEAFRLPGRIREHEKALTTEIETYLKRVRKSGVVVYNFIPADEVLRKLPFFYFSDIHLRFSRGKQVFYESDGDKPVLKPKPFFCNGHRILYEVCAGFHSTPEDFVKQYGKDLSITKASDFHEAIPCEEFPNLMYGGSQILKLQRDFGNPFKLLEKSNPFYLGVSKIIRGGYAIRSIDAHLVEHHDSHADDLMRVNWDLEAKRFLRVEGDKNGINWWDYGVREYMDRVFQVKSGEPYKEGFEDKVRKQLGKRLISDREFLSPEELEAHAVLDQVFGEMGIFSESKR